MIGLGLRQLQQALDRKADELQKDFIQISEDLRTVSGELLELRGQDREPKLEEQSALRTRQQQLADEINAWRERSRKVLQTGGGVGLRAYLEELSTLEDPEVEAAVERAIHFIEDPDEAIAEFQAGQAAQQQDVTPGARLIQRARTEYDLRERGPEPRRRTAFEFANRAGLAQDDEALAELEAVMDDEDEIVREIATLTVIQILRFRAMRQADLSVAHQAVEKMTQIEDRAVVPALVEVLENPRTGYEMDESGETRELGNTRTRMMALIRLVDWHTPDAQQAMRGRQFDPSKEITQAALRALEVFPGPWTGPESKQDSAPQ